MIQFCVIQVLQIIIHEQFNYRRVHNDIALLKLKTEAVYSDYIQPACLLRSEDRSKLSGDMMSGTVSRSTYNCRRVHNDWALLKLKTDRHKHYVHSFI